MKETLRRLTLGAVLGGVGLLASVDPAGARPIRAPRASFSVAFGGPFVSHGFVQFGHPVRYSRGFGYRSYGPARFCGLHANRHAYFAPVHRFRHSRFERIHRHRAHRIAPGARFHSRGRW
jgi:hypothetical protein